MVGFDSGQLVLHRVPMPHTVNKAFILSRGRFIKSGSARLFDSLIKSWMLENSLAVKQARDVALSWINSGNVLRVDIDFFFQKKRVFSVSKKADFVKSIDTNNRIKPLLDGVSRILEVDDKFFFDHLIRKKFCQITELEHCTVTVRPLSLDEVLSRC